VNGPNALGAPIAEGRIEKGFRMRSKAPNRHLFHESGVKWLGEWLCICLACHNGLLHLSDMMHLSIGSEGGKMANHLLVCWFCFQQRQSQHLNHVRACHWQCCKKF